MAVRYNINPPEWYRHTAAVYCFTKFLLMFLDYLHVVAKIKRNLLLATQMNLVRYFWSQERDALNLLCVPRATKACNSRIDKPIQNTTESILSVIKTGKSPYLPTNGRNDEVNEF